MKLSFILLLAVCGFACPAFSQDDKAAVTDEELMKYAEVMDSVNEMTASVRIMLADMVKENDSISAARYNELSKIANDDAKLAEAKATPEEIAFVKRVAEKKNEETAKINETYQKMAKEYVTVPVFNKVKKALASDDSLKTRYETLMVELGKDDPSGD
jgi:hypothetical protein